MGDMNGGEEGEVVADWCLGFEESKWPEKIRASSGFEPMTSTNTGARKACYQRS